MSAPITPNQWTILESLQAGPQWIRSFQPAKPLLQDLVARGLVERCRPHLGRGSNMVRLTLAGCSSLEIDPASVPRVREQVAPVEKCLTLGAIKGGLSDQVRSVCEAFVHAVKGGEPVASVITELAAREDVQRPAIWKRLRQGGVIPDYKPRAEGGQGRPVGGGKPGYTEHRRNRALVAAAAVRAEPSANQFVDRDPCPRCGVRGDYGCNHSRAPLGTSL